MSIRAVLCNPQSAALGAAAALVAGVVASPLAAQDTGWHGNPHLRPVPKVRSAAIAPDSARGTDSAQRPGWNLQWRTSPEIAAQQARQVSDAAFAQTPPAPRDAQVAAAENYTPRIVANGSNRSSSPSEPSARLSQTNSLRPTEAPNLQQVAFTSPQEESPRSGFSLPDNDLGGPTLAPPNPSGQSLLGPALQAPAPSAEQMLPPPAPSTISPSQTAPRPAPAAATDKAPNDNLENLFGFGPTTQQRPAGQGTTPAQPSAGDSSIREMIQGEPAGPSLRQPAPLQPRNLQELPPGVPQEESADSPSDMESFAPNPFENRDTNPSTPRGLESQRDRLDRDLLDGPGTSETFGTPEIFGTEEDGPANSGTGLSCDEFRERIRSATIDQVSLDPSPPFRPDVIDVKEFDKLKDRFNENQKVRVWRSIDGRPLGTGRLDDLAYENAIIRTDFGTKEELPLNQLSEADLAYISQNWGLPTECLIEQVAYTPRQWTPTTMTYTASNLCHKPLYFEEVNLERYGHTAGPLAQPIISSAHFFLNIAVLPYKMGVHAPSECQYALGYYRPGNCAPWIIPPVPLSVRGAWFQATAVTGTALLIP